MANPIMQEQSSQRKKLEQKYNSSRANLLLVVAFTAINLVLLITNSDRYFLFSAFFPYFISSLGMFLCGHFPEEYYMDMIEEMLIFDNSLFVVLLVISLVITLFYFLAWLLSKKQRVGWLIFALVFFSIDTLAMLLINGFAVDSVVDILFHVWVIYYLVVGISAHSKLKKLPPEEVSVWDTDENSGRGEDSCDPDAHETHNS